MLTFEEKLAIINAFPELERKDVSMGRVNFHYEESDYEKKIVVYHLHPNGNGFVYAGHIDGYVTDDKGLVNIRDSSAGELRALVQASIRSLAPKTARELAITGDAEAEESWIGPKNEVLLLVQEDGVWHIYAGLNLEDAYESYEEAERYLIEEGFRRK
jgi:hypothetical protein